MSTQYIVKLGGSLITDKNTQDTFDELGILACVDWLHLNKKSIQTIVLGGGSFGHIAATKLIKNWSSITVSQRKKQIQTIQQSMQVLRKYLSRALGEKGITSVAVSPEKYSSINKTVQACAEVIKSGNILLTHGAVLMDTQKLTIVSSEDIMMDLVRHIDSADGAKKNFEYVFFTKTKGVLDADGAIIPRIKTAAVIETFGTPNDTTGGMAQKLKNAFTLAATGNAVWITHPSIFGDGRGTKIVGE